MNFRERFFSKTMSDRAFAYLLLLPVIAIFIVIILYPFINTLIMAFTNRSMLSDEVKFIGIDNFRTIFDNPNFWGVLKNTIVFVAGSVILPFILGYIWAIVLNEKFPFSRLLRGITLVDWIIPSSAIGFLWMWIFNGEYGVLNGILRMTNIIDQNINWLGRSDTAMMVVILARTWQVLPWYMAFLTGGLSGVSKEQAEAAKIDGAGNLKIFSSVIFPAMRPTILLVLLLGTINSLQCFDLIWVITGGGPARGTTTFAIEVYQNAFKNWKIGLASAIGVVWMILLSVFSFFYISSNMKDSD